MGSSSQPSRNFGTPVYDKCRSLLRTAIYAGNV
jgi:hypothetical protein